VAKVQVRLLGPVDVSEAGASRRVAGLRPKAVLAVLGLAAGQTVSTDRLLEVVWGERPPATGLNTLQRHVSYLRSVLGGRETIVARPPGYVLALGPQATDVQVATGLIEQARRADDPARRVADLRAALALWRGRPLADVADLPWLAGQAERLTDLRVAAVQSVNDARLALGEHAQIIAEIEALVEEHPYREQLHEQLMLALYRSGRQADALGAYQRLRARLGDDLGIDPGAGPRELAAAILRQDASLDLALPRAATLLSTPVPRQLPPDIAGFVGREAELLELDAGLAAAGTTRTVPITLISGTAGVGKTTLAVHWAHRVADRFRDGQLYVDLRGFDASAPPTDPVDVVRGFLDAFGVPEQRVPTSRAAQVALLRSVLADRRVLLVLDNARDVDQVRPLLPNSPGCLVVVTSRNQLTALVAADGAQPLPLDLLSGQEAWQLLRQRLGRERVPAEAAAVEEIISRCARLPLALAIVAARAVIQPHLPLSVLAGELRGGRGPLPALQGGDPATDVGAVFSWSYQQLRPETARLFRLLGLHPGPDLTAPAAASLAARPVAQVRPLLAELVRASLITEHRPGRYWCHDLLRAYAADLARRLDREVEREAATHRLLDHYLHTAHAADRLLYPHRGTPALPLPEPGVTPETPRDDEWALAWLTTERPVLRAAIDRAVALGFDRPAVELAWTLASFFTRRGHGHDWVATARAALLAAQRLTDPITLGRAYRNLASAYSWTGRLPEAYTQFTHALKLAVRTNDVLGQAHTHHRLSILRDRQDRLIDALDHAQQALDLFRLAGHRRGEAYALNGLGWGHARLGAYELAIEACTEALDRLEEFADRQGRAHAWDSLGYAHHHLGEFDRARACLGEAITLHREFGDRLGEASSLDHLGDAEHSAADPRAAGDRWRQALAIYEELDHTDAERLRAKLAGRHQPRPLERVLDRVSAA
jgi:DNA-binding SARP family transcriptional activator